MEVEGVDVLWCGEVEGGGDVGLVVGDDVVLGVVGENVGFDDFFGGKCWEVEVCVGECVLWIEGV